LNGAVEIAEFDEGSGGEAVASDCEKLVAVDGAAGWVDSGEAQLTGYLGSA